MNNLTGNEDDSLQHRDREITLGTTTVLGIFFGLAVLCAVFFGFGYSLGSKHVSTPAVSANGDPVNPRSFSTFKPSPGSPLNSAAKTPEAAALPPAPLQPPSPASVKAPLPGTAAPPDAFESDLSLSKTSHTPPPSGPPAPATTAIAAPVVLPPGQFIVQVAALSHQEDAEMIATELQRKGYAVVIRPDPNDKLLHLQLGPYPSRKDAETMRQKLLADGFNAYIK